MKGKGWVESIDLEIGDYLTDNYGQSIRIDDIIVSTKPVEVFNIDVEYFDTYFVSNLNILTHNSSSSCVLGQYLPMQKDKNITGQAHHLNQNAAFRDVIPKNDAIALELEGNAFRDIGTEHYKAHESLEKFWDIHRQNGTRPTIKEYHDALYTSLRDSGKDHNAATKAVKAAIEDTEKYQLKSTDLVPRVPSKMVQKK